MWFNLVRPDKVVEDAYNPVRDKIQTAINDSAAVRSNFVNSHQQYPAACLSPMIPAAYLKRYTAHAPSPKSRE